MGMAKSNIQCIITLLASLLLVSCSIIQTEKKYVVLNYSDFGPPSLCEGLIGSDWWQWQEHGESRPSNYDIKVVVYRGYKLKHAQKQYPVIPRRNQDYRYVSYDQAIAFLNDSIEEAMLIQLADKLKETKARIENEMRSKSIDVNFRLDQRVEGF